MFLFHKSAPLLAGALLAGVVAAEVVNYQAVASTKDLMVLMAIPASNALFDVKEKPTDKEWDEYRKQALMLTEAGNLLMMPGRFKTGKTKGEPEGNLNTNPEFWNQAAELMREAGKSAVAAIEKKDGDVLAGDVGEKILTSCSTCHDRYMVK